MESETPIAAKPSYRVRLSFLLWLFVILFIIYPLSIGPAIKFHFVDGNEGWLLRCFYFPLFSAEQHFPFLARLLSWYLQLWGLNTHSDL